MAELVYAPVLGTGSSRIKSSSLFLPTNIYESNSGFQKGLKTNLNIFVDKKTIEEKIGLRLFELSKTVNLILIFPFIVFLSIKTFRFVFRPFLDSTVTFIIFGGQEETRTLKPFGTSS